MEETVYCACCDAEVVEADLLDCEECGLECCIFCVHDELCLYCYDLLLEQDDEDES